MRIIAGKFRSRVLQTPKGDVCRPAMGRTREAIFSMLEAREVNWAEARVLDIFAGCGSLAFEALSRGAKEAWLVENEPLVIRTIERNRESLGVSNQVKICKEEALKFLRRGATLPFNVIFLDPPYRRNVVNQCFNLLVTGGWMALDAWVISELEAEYAFKWPKELIFSTERLFGQTRVVLAKYQKSLDELDN